MKNWLIGVRVFVALSLLTGILYPLSMAIVGDLIFPYQVRGSLIENNGSVVGSELLSQKFVDKKYFQSRPSMNDFNGTASVGSNMSLGNDTLKKATTERKEAGATHEQIYASGSGLDPHISPEAAHDQVGRIVGERKLTLEQRHLVLALIQEYTEPRQWGFLGEPRVNVLKLNLALDHKL
ncbi:K(+)-transporting ATPase subunit C [Bdellovibrio sp. HCB290]|uniref:K(+)-transporting ATPase subunit C n=1 Tax=Bdellovibrio sp. HCB290 TaxID=3394356 RepID=UPI0039B50989